MVDEVMSALFDSVFEDYEPTDAGEAYFDGVTAPPRFVEVASGEVHACGLEAAGTVACWGGNESGQLGDGTLLARAVASPVAGLAEVVHIAAGQRFSCALHRAGTIWCWGANERGQLGDGSRSNRLVPTQVIGIPRADDMTVIDDRVCAWSSGTWACWGEAAP